MIVWGGTLALLNNVENSKLRTEPREIFMSSALLNSGKLFQFYYNGQNRLFRILWAHRVPGWLSNYKFVAWLNFMQNQLVSEKEKCLHPFSKLVLFVMIWILIFYEYHFTVNLIKIIFLYVK